MEKTNSNCINDTIQLLKECDAGTKMAVSTIDGVMEHIRDSRMKRLLNESKDHHASLGNDIHRELVKYGSEEKDPAPMAKGMSWMKTNMKLGMNDSDATAADLVTDGCNMGVKYLHKYLNQYKSADETAKSLCCRLASIEETLCRDLREYL